MHYLQPFIPGQISFDRDHTFSIQKSRGKYILGSFHPVFFSITLPAKTDGCRTMNKLIASLLVTFLFFLPQPLLSTDKDCDQDDCEMTGECLHGDCKNGFGMMAVETCNICGFHKDVLYEGEFKNEKFNGQGKLFYLNKMKYEGGFKDGKQSGQGTLTIRYTRKYVGEWRDGKENGCGTEFQSCGLQYDGEWREGKYHGKGTETLPDGSMYVGQFANGQFNGVGTYRSSDGSKYVGRWKDGRKNGYGVATLPDGTKFEGTWKNDQLLKGFN